MLQVSPLAYRGGLIQEEDGGGADQGTGYAEAALFTSRQSSDQNATWQCTSHLQTHTALSLSSQVMCLLPDQDWAGMQHCRWLNIAGRVLAWRLHSSLPTSASVQAARCLSISTAGKQAQVEAGILVHMRTWVLRERQSPMTFMTCFTRVLR